MARLALGVLTWVVAGAFAASGCARTDTASPRAGPSPSPWVSRAIPEARGDVKAGADGRPQAIRYAGWSTEDYGRFRTYAYDDRRPEVAIGKAPMPAVAGDP